MQGAINVMQGAINVIVSTGINEQDGDVQWLYRASTKATSLNLNKFLHV